MSSRKYSFGKSFLFFFFEIYLLSLWLSVSIGSLFIVNLHLRFSDLLNFKYEKTIIRKYFHFLAIIVYTSGILFDTHLLTMCSVAFIVLLLLLEVEILFLEKKEDF